MKTCPQCHLLLERIESQGASVWACRNCGGSWLAPCDLQRALADGSAALAGIGSDYAGVAGEGTFEGLTKTCPECRIRPLSLAPIPEVPGLSVLTCGQCGGVWLQPRDRAALAAQAGPAAAVEGPEPSAPAPDVAAGEETQPSGIPAPAAGEPPPAEPEGEAPVPAAPAPGAAPERAEDVLMSPAPEAGTEMPSAPPAAPATAGEPSTALPDLDVPPAAHAEPAEPAEPVGPRGPVAAAGPIAAFEAGPVPFAPQPPPADVPARPSAGDLEAGSVLLELARAGGSLVCPRCLKVLAPAHTECPDCGAELVDPGYVVRCPRCGTESSFAVEQCAGCGVALRSPRLLDSLYPARPRGSRHEPLTEPRNAAPEIVRSPAPSGATAPVTRPARWCPHCRRGYGADVSYCVDCGVALVTSGYRIRCGRCLQENTIGADRCWQCHAPLHPGPGQGPSLPGPPIYGAPPPVRIRTTQQFSLDSCSSSVLAAVAALAAVGALVAGAWR